MPALMIRNFVWDQGTDLDMDFTYSRGSTQETAAPVDLTGWSLRMDIASQGTGTRVYTFNSDELVEPADAVTEAVLGTDGSIKISVPRSLTLDGGDIYLLMKSVTPQLVFDYDIILRDQNDKQFKFASGTISVEESVTLWL